MSSFHQRYDGGALTRGEFVTHMERVDETLKSIDERLSHIEERLSRPRRLFFRAAATVSGRAFLIVAGIILTWAATRYGVPGSPLGLP